MSELAPLAPLERLAGRLGYTPEGAEAIRAADLLADASDLILDEAGAAGAEWGDTLAVPRRVAAICVDVAYRAFVNPEALGQRSIGDSSKSYDRAGLQGGEALYLTDEERKAVKRACGGSGLRAVTLVSPYSGDAPESLLGS